jgi:hypothetical protein
MDSLDKGPKLMKSDMRFGKWNIRRPYTTSPHTRGVFSVLMFYLGSCRWFVLCSACIPYLVLVQVSGVRD